MADANDEVKEAERLAAGEGEGDGEENVALCIPFYPSSFGSSSDTPDISSAARQHNLVQLQFSLQPPAKRRGGGLLPLTSLPSLLPRAYHIRTCSTTSLSPTTSLSFTPTLLASPSSLSSSLRVALTSTLSPSLTSTLAYTLSTPSSLTLSTLHSSPSHSALLHLTLDPNHTRLGGRLTHRLPHGSLVLEGEGASLAGAAWVWGGQEEGGEGRVGVRWLKGVAECAVRLSLPLSRCPPFNRLYAQSSLVLPASTLLLPPLPHPSPTPAYVDLRMQPDRFALAHSPPTPRLSTSPSPSPLSTARLSLEVGVTANVNRRHRLDVGVGWSTSGVYVHLALTSPSTTWSFPLYIAPPSLLSSSPLLSPFALCVGVPVSSVFAYTFLIAPLYHLYQRKAYPPTPSPSSSPSSPPTTLVYRHVMQPLAAVRRAASDALVLVSARYGWAVAASTRGVRPSHPVFRWGGGGGGEGGGGEVVWVEVREVEDVIGFWVRDGRVVVGEGRKSRMLGMEAIPRPKLPTPPLVLGLYLRYRSGGVERHVFVGEREGAVVPDSRHRACSSG